MAYEDLSLKPYQPTNANAANAIRPNVIRTAVRTSECFDLSGVSGLSICFDIMAIPPKTQHIIAQATQYIAEFHDELYGDI